MKPTNIETCYGKFRTLHEFELYFEKLIKKAYKDGFDEGYKYLKLERLHKLGSFKEE